MPLQYAEDTLWPPVLWRPALSKMHEHAAWFSGDSGLLAEVYGGEIAYRVRSTWWKFWSKVEGEQITHRVRTQIHLPLASDIAATSSSLLFSEQPDFSFEEEDKKTRERLDLIINETNLYSTLLEAAEISAALGGVYLRVTWDKNEFAFPYVDVLQPDQVVPEFYRGRLRAATYWRTLDIDNQHRVWRHLERYEKGRIFHGLYIGSVEKLGEKVSLNRHPETVGLLDQITTPNDSLLITYIPNMRPNRLWRAGPLSELGQSDYSGTETLMDALDETWTSWMRDIRLGKARIVVPEEFLDRTESGFNFDLDQEVFTPMDIDSRDGAKAIQDFQFEIRAEAHSHTAMQLVERIITHAGYSPQSFGLHIEGRAESGTALRIRERKTLVTQQKKRQYWQDGLPHTIENLLAVDNFVYNTGVVVQRPGIQMADSITPDESEVAETIETLYRAEAISLRQRLRMLHPNWKDEDIDEEMKAILSEGGRVVPDPLIDGEEDGFPETV